MRRSLLALALVLTALVGPVFGQGSNQPNQPIPVQIWPTPAVPCALLQTATAAAGSAATATITVTSGFVYICNIELTLVCGTTTCTAIAATTTSTTNLGGLTFLMPSTGAGAAAGTAFTQFFTYNPPMKSAAPGTNVVVGATPAVTNGTWRINVYGYAWPN